MNQAAQHITVYQSDSAKEEESNEQMHVRVSKQSKITYDSPVHVRSMFQCTSGSKRAHILPILKKANVTIDLNGKTTSCDGMQPAPLKCTTSHLVPHLGGVVASSGTLSRAGAYTLARACASAL